MRFCFEWVEYGITLKEVKATGVRRRDGRYVVVVMKNTRFEHKMVDVDYGM
jgi:hypothetical protein